MSSTWIDLLQTLLGCVAMALLIIPLGSLVTNLLFPEHTSRTPEHLLWSIAIGLPLATLGCTLGARLPGHYTLAAITLCIAIACAIHNARQPAASLAFPHLHHAGQILLLVAVITLGPALAVIDVEIGHRLFISTVMADWAIRVPLVGAATKQPYPILNPLSALNGSAPALHYYYFWYLLSAEIARSIHISARSALTASCVWAGYDLIAVLFLASRYLVGVRRRNWQHYVTGLFLLGVIGLDLLPLIPRLLVHREHPDFEIEWWREDRTPSLLSTILYAPHHIAGLAFAVTAFILLLRLTDRRLSWNRVLLFSCVAGAIVASIVGTSTYIAILFATTSLLWTIDLVRRRQWTVLATLAGCGLVAFALSSGYLHQLASTSTGNQIGVGTRSAAHFAVFRLRNQHFADTLLQRRHLPANGVWLLRRLVALLLLFFELGFFAFVLAARLRRDLPRWRSLAPHESAMWCLLLGAALPGLVLSSAVITFANDFGLHAGILVRFTLLLWATPWVCSLVRNRRTLQRASSGGKLFLAAAASCLVLGLAGEAAQLTLERFSLPLIETRALAKRTDTFTADRLSYRLYNIRAAHRALDRVLPPNAILQFDPAGKLQPAMALYSNRQIASSDDGCGTGFGGDHALCEPIRLRLHALFGVAPYKLLDSVLPLQDRGSVEEPTPSITTPAHEQDFRSVCQDLHLNAILVDSEDPEWAMRDSWVWTEAPIFTSATARAFLCPPSPTSGLSSRTRP